MHRESSSQDQKPNVYGRILVLVILLLGTFVAIELGGQHSIDDSSQVIVYISIAIALAVSCFAFTKRKK